MVKVTCLLAKAGSGVGFSFGVRALTRMEIPCVKGMFRLKLISSEKNSVFKGLRVHRSSSLLLSKVHLHKLCLSYAILPCTQIVMHTKYACTIAFVGITHTDPNEHVHVNSSTVSIISKLIVDLNIMVDSIDVKINRK